MKIALSLLALPVVSAMNAKAAANAVRKLNDYNGEQEEEEENSWMKNYEQVYMTCDGSMKVLNEEGEYEYGAVVTRFCPTGATCDKDGKKKCDAGYGDIVVGIQTYMEQFMEQFERAQEQNQYNNNQNDEFDFNFAEFGQCAEFEMENQNQDGYDNGEEVQYFIGPLCVDGDITIAMFKDEDCAYQYEDITFESLTGVPLPWSNTNIVQDEDCKPYYCYGANDDGEYEYNEFCTTLYENANLKCEEELEFYSMYGKDTTGCETIQAMLPASSGGNAGKVIIILLVVAIVVGGAFFFMQQKKKSSIESQGLAM